MKEIIHAEKVLEHLEAFEAEADHLGLSALRGRLEKHRGTLAHLLYEAAHWDEKKNNNRTQLKHLEKKANDFYGHTTFQLPYLLSEERAVPFYTGRNLNVINRLRYRWRALEKFEGTCPAVADFCADHGAFLLRYDTAVDAFLAAVACCQHAQKEALLQSQLIRDFLAKAKTQLLAACHEDSESHKSIKKRVVRTKKAHWVTRHGPADDDEAMFFVI